MEIDRGVAVALDEKSDSDVKDNYLEEAMKMRNLSEEFRADHGLRPLTILGLENMYLPEEGTKIDENKTADELEL
ncbi:GLUCAN SYNTHASE-LIKE 8 family protein [Artemisia annua]|uniref:GLUCAN SYNTHASE-LIKE 8 family protein n=1 Tax=Artemisia annua TaxID=35608 RepID=A0A2U1NUN0_ARTAN|nr:GLUCAN SYNTHASE-LIKE 8 family protein [Artemisia annua]